MNFDIKNHIYDSDLARMPITDTVGLGHKFTVNGDNVETKASCNPRYITLDITSFMGAIGAMHYYGRIKVYDISNVVVDSEDKSRIGYSMCGYLGGYKVPEEFCPFAISLNRPITDEELKGSKNENSRFYGYYEGDLINAFNTEEEVIRIGLQCIKEMFTGNWKVGISAYTEEYDAIIHISEIDLHLSKI